MLNKLTSTNSLVRKLFFFQSSSLFCSTQEAVIYSYQIKLKMYPTVTKVFNVVLNNIWLESNVKRIQRLFPSVLRTALMCLPMQLSFHRNFPFPVPVAETTQHVLHQIRLGYYRHIPQTSHLFMLCQGNTPVKIYECCDLLTLTR